jgi:hypothetical protein
MFLDFSSSSIFGELPTGSRGVDITVARFSNMGIMLLQCVIVVIYFAVAAGCGCCRVQPPVAAALKAVPFLVQSQDSALFVNLHHGHKLTLRRQE